MGWGEGGVGQSSWVGHQFRNTGPPFNPAYCQTSGGCADVHIARIARGGGHPPPAGREVDKGGPEKRGTFQRHDFKRRTN